MPACHLLRCRLLACPPINLVPPPRPTLHPAPERPAACSSPLPPRADIKAWPVLHQPERKHKGRTVRCHAGETWVPPVEALLGV